MKEKTKEMKEMHNFDNIVKLFEQLQLTGVLAAGG
jgi:hypothetical protein